MTTKTVKGSDAIPAKSQQGVTVSGIRHLLGAANAFFDDGALCAAGVPIKYEAAVGRCIIGELGVFLGDRHAQESY